MKKIILSSLILLIFGALNFVSAQSVKRLYFKKGATALTVTGNLNGYRSERVFVMRVRAGQTITTEQLKTNSSLQYVSVFINDPKGEEVSGDFAADCHSRREISPTVAGDYRIQIVECQKADRWRGNFKVKISVK